MATTITKANVDKIVGLPVRSVKQQTTAGGVVMAFYGAGGSGKTTLASQIALVEDGAPVLFLDAEGGTSSIAHMDNVDVVDIGSWKQLMEVSQAVSTDESLPYKSIVIDNLTEIQSVNMRGIVGNALPEWTHWNRSTSDMLRLIRMYRELARFRGINVLFLVWEKIDKNENTGRMRRGVNFTPSLANSFPGIVNTVGYITTVKNPPLYTRCLSFAPDPDYDSKFRRAPTDASNDIPHEIYYNINEYPLVDIINTVRYGKPWPKGKYLKPERSR
jgi:hypothetical protein